jgi:hypothetical protein
LIFSDYDLEKAAKFRKNKLILFKKAEPYYTENIKKIRHRPMKILSVTEDAIRFNRTPTGIHYDSKVNMQLTDSHSFTYSNIYKILGKMLSLYNHSFLPNEKKRQSIHSMISSESFKKVWFSEPLDFSKPLEEAARLTSEYAEKNTRFKQNQPIRIQYRVIAMDNTNIEICGECSPDVRIGKKMKIRQILRKIKLRREDEVVTEDMIYLDFKDKKGKGGIMRLKLKLLPHETHGDEDVESGRIINAFGENHLDFYKKTPLKNTHQ